MKPVSLENYILLRMKKYVFNRRIDGIFYENALTLTFPIIVQDGINVQDGHFLRFPARLLGRL